MFIGFVVEITNILKEVITHDSMRIIYNTQLTPGLYSDGLMSYNRTLYLIFSNIIQRGIQRNELEINCDVKDISKDIMISFRGLTFEWCVRDNFDLTKETKEYFTRFINKIEKRG